MPDLKLRDALVLRGLFAAHGGFERDHALEETIGVLDGHGLHFAVVLQDRHVTPPRRALRLLC